MRPIMRTAKKMRKLGFSFLDAKKLAKAREMGGLDIILGTIDALKIPYSIEVTGKDSMDDSPTGIIILRGITYSWGITGIDFDHPRTSLGGD